MKNYYGIYIYKIIFSNLKIEEFLLFHENIFDKFKISIKEFQPYLEINFSSVSKLISLVQESVLKYVNNFKYIINIYRKKFVKKKVFSHYK